MKKILFILSLLLVIFTFNISINAASSISNGQADKGETVALDIKLSSAKTVKSGAISFEYDKDKFEIVSGEWKVTNTIVSTFDMKTEKGAFAFMSPTSISGTIFKITFKVKSNTTYGKYTISGKLEFENEKSEKSSETITGTLTVGCSHNLTVKDTKDENLASKATCTQPAKYYYKCSKCGEKGTKTYENGSALGHTGGSASCSKKAVCTRCNKEYGNLLDHKFGEWNVVEEATEQKEGLKERVCSGCNKKETEKISILGHTHKYEENIEFDSTCLGKGLKKYVCSCGDSYVETINQKEHNYTEFETLVEPTETTYGYKQKECSLCGQKVLEKIEKLTHEHKYGNYYNDKEGHYKECSCGNKTNKETHTYKDPIEKEGYIEFECSECGYIKTEIIPVEVPQPSYTIYYIIMAVEGLLILMLSIILLIPKKKRK